MSMTEQFNVQPAPQRKVLGIEFGSTRIKAVLTDGHGAVLGNRKSYMGKSAGQRHLDLSAGAGMERPAGVLPRYGGPVPDAVRQSDHRSGCIGIQLA
mgnify:CR=1 FL=1